MANVRVSVTFVDMSRSWICHVRGYVTFVDMSKRIYVSSNFFHRRVATPFWFFHAKRRSNIPTGTPLTGASNADEVGRNRDSEPISGLTACVNAAIG